MTQKQYLFSIIIPTYNRPERLITCIKSLTKLDYPCDQFEVIVVDDGSSQPMENIVHEFGQEINLKIIRQKNAGPASARNTGANHAQGQYLVFTDDDCTPAADWLKTLFVRFQQTPDCMIGGHVVNALINNFYSKASQLLVDYIYFYYNQKSSQPSFFASNNIALPTKSFLETGGFDTTFPLAAGEDREFCDRWLSKNNQMVYAPEVKVYHHHELTLTKFWRQHFNYGCGAFYFHQIRANRKSTEIKVEPLSFYWQLLTYPLQQKITDRSPFTNLITSLYICVLMLISQIANIYGFFWQKLQYKS